MSKKQRAMAVIDDEPRAVLFGIWKVPGQGYASCRVELPQSVIEHYAADVSEPDILEVALTRTEHAMRRQVMG